MTDIIETTKSKTKRYGKLVAVAFAKTTVVLGAAVVGGIVIGDQINKHKS